MKPTTLKAHLRTVLCVAMIVSAPLMASDHLDVFSTEKDLLDLYVFKSPANAGNVVMVLDMARVAESSTRFPDDHLFSIALKAVSIEGAGDNPGFVPSGEVEAAFSCRFDEPLSSANHPQSGTCTAPWGSSVVVSVNDENGVAGEGFRVFAGVRSDPFFMAAIEVLWNFVINSTKYPDPGESDTHGQNSMSIVIEADASRLGESLMAFRAEVMSECSLLTRLWCDPRRDSVGRPEVTNMILAVPFFDAGQRLTFLRGSFNENDSFAPRAERKASFLSRFDANLRRWDKMDHEVDWLSAAGSHPLSEILYHDYLVLDLSKPFTEQGFMDIEKSMLAGRSHQTSGGRWLGEDVVDVLMTWWISRDKEAFGDFVDQPTRPPSLSFPYVAAPN